MANQKEQLKKVLKRRTRKGITQLEAMQDLGILRLSERIRELESAGHMIQRTTEKGFNRFGHSVRYTRYRLVG